MESWGVFFLGVIAFAAALQAAFLVALLLFGLKLARSLGALQLRLDRELGPALANFARLSRAAAEVAEIAASRTRRADHALETSISRPADTASAIQGLASHSFPRIAWALALAKGVRRELEVFFAKD